MNKEQIQHTLKEIELQFNAPLSQVTFTQTGGPADIIAFPKNNDEVSKVVNYCQTNKIPWLVLGNASNLIVRDGGIRGMVILLSKMNQITIEKETINVQAGAKLIETSDAALEANLTGLEFACGIPGSVGGATYMNAGAYGGEIKDVFLSAEILLSDGTIQTFTLSEMQFAYRNSVLQQMQGVVLNVTFALSLGDYNEIKAKMTELTKLREAKQPLEYPSCGSVFKRPEGYFTGQLIQEAGLQGMMIGGAQISTKHAGFIVNINQATATDYIELIQHIQQIILEKFDVTLETEVRIIGEEVADD